MKRKILYFIIILGFLLASCSAVPFMLTGAAVVSASTSTNFTINNGNINNFKVNINYTKFNINGLTTGYEENNNQYRPFFNFTVSNSLINGLLSNNAYAINITLNFNRDISSEYLNDFIPINKNWFYQKAFWCQDQNGNVAEQNVTATTLIGNSQIVYTVKYNVSSITAVGNTITCYDPINGNGKYEQGKGTASVSSTNLSLAFNNSIISGNTIILGISLNDNTTAINQIGSNLSPGLKWQNATSHILGNAISEQIFYAENITGGFINIEVNSSSSGPTVRILAGEYSGLKIDSKDVNVSNITADSGTVLQCNLTNINPTNTKELFFMQCQTNATESTAFVAGSNFTIRQALARQAIEDRQINSIAAGQSFIINMTFPTATTWVASAVTFILDTNVTQLNGSITNKTNPVANDVINITFNMTDDSMLDTGQIVYNGSGANAYYNFSFRSLRVGSQFMSMNLTIPSACSSGCVLNFTGIANDTAGNVNQNSTLLTIGIFPPAVPSVNFSQLINQRLIHVDYTNGTDCLTIDNSTFRVNGTKVSDTITKDSMNQSCRYENGAVQFNNTLSQYNQTINQTCYIYTNATQKNNDIYFFFSRGSNGVANNFTELRADTRTSGAELCGGTSGDCLGLMIGDNTGVGQFTGSNEQYFFNNASRKLLAYTINQTGSTIYTYLYYNSRLIANSSFATTFGINSLPFFIGNRQNAYGGFFGNIWVAGCINFSANSDQVNWILDQFEGGNFSWPLIPAPPIPDTTPPSITYYNLTNDTGCESWNSDKNTACSTSSLTPTLQFNTSENAWCAIAGAINNGSLNKNYTNMGSSRNCTGSGEGTTEHFCTLTSQDELVYDTSYLFISCKDINNNQNMNSTSGPLKVSVTNLESNARESIGIGIQNALLSGYTNYTDLQIYGRNLSNAQVLGTFDRAAKKGNKMWAFNRIGVSDNYVNMVNLTPTLYTLEFANKTSEYITNQTERLINATK